MCAKRVAFSCRFFLFYAGHLHLFYGYLARVLQVHGKLMTKILNVAVHISNKNVTLCVLFLTECMMGAGCDNRLPDYQQKSIFGLGNHDIQKNCPIGRVKPYANLTTQFTNIKNHIPIKHIYALLYGQV